MWARMTPDQMNLAIQVGLSELAMSGCTTAFDHQYLFPNGCTLDDAIHTASDVGMRFHASRGSMSLGQSKGGLPPDSCVEEEAIILKDCQRVIEKYHDSKSGSMTRVVLAPCSPFSVTENLMVESAKMARNYNVHLHTHLAESLDEERFTLSKYQLRPVGLMEKLGWVGNDVWFAHSVHVNDSEISLYAKYGCGVAHCPCSNMRLASGFAPVKKYRKAGVKVGLGVDGSSSNDGSHMLGEARQSMLLARLLLSQNPGGPPADKSEWLSARDALEMATIGGAAVLGRSDIGSLEVGKCADFFAVDLNRVGFAGGSMIDPVAAVVFCAPTTVDYTVVNGRYIVKDGHMTSLDLTKVIAKCNSAAAKMING
jgi:8-oxoguanine deaminase